MGALWSLDVDEKALAWCAERLNQSPADAHNAISQMLGRLASDCTQHLGVVLADGQPPRYVRRLWGCVLYHWQRFAPEENLELETVVKRVRAGDLGPNTASSDLLREVTLAQALEFCDPRAAEIFEKEFMPVVRLNARRLSGQRGEDLVENFAADLVLPAPDKPPRIARYQGRTSLTGWLRVVTINYLTSAFRRRESRPLVEDAVGSTSGDPATTSDRRICQELLARLICGALGGLAAEDRLLIRMLLLDGVPQGQLAKALGIHSGNLTRRRQKISDAIWQGVKRGASQSGQDRAASDCLELVVVDGDQQLAQSLATVLAKGLQDEEDKRDRNATT